MSSAGYDCAAVAGRKELLADASSVSRPQVLVAHPGRQHSHELTLALAEQGMLRRYVTGVPTHRQAGWWWFRPFIATHAATYEISIDPQLVRHNFISPVVRKSSYRWFPRGLAASLAHRGDGWFDRCVASQLDSLQPDIFVGYENSALYTFRRARAAGIVTVLDAASFHPDWQDRFYQPIESLNAHRRIVERKEAEVALADHILTVSEYARESYLDCGLSKERVHAMPLGVDTENFRLRSWDKSELARRPLRLAFVGHIDERKGVDVLRAAMFALKELCMSLSLSIFGKRNSKITFEGTRNVVERGWLPQSELSAELREHDVLVLPSRHDSFGMVVAEAMACGLPVIVSENVGAKEMVTAGANGLIVQVDDSIALANAIRWFVEHKGEIPRMGLVARQAAERYSWQVYRKRVVKLLLTFSSMPCETN